MILFSLTVDALGVECFTVYELQMVAESPLARGPVNSTSINFTVKIEGESSIQSRKRLYDSLKEVDRTRLYKCDSTLGVVNASEGTPSWKVIQVASLIEAFF